MRVKTTTIGIGEEMAFATNNLAGMNVILDDRTFVQGVIVSTHLTAGRIVRRSARGACGRGGGLDVGWAGVGIGWTGVGVGWAGIGVGWASIGIGWAGVGVGWAGIGIGWGFSVGWAGVGVGCVGITVGWAGVGIGWAGVGVGWAGVGVGLAGGGGVGIGVSWAGAGGRWCPRGSSAGHTSEAWGSCRRGVMVLLLHTHLGP